MRRFEQRFCIAICMRHRTACRNCKAASREKLLELLNASRSTDSKTMMDTAVSRRFPHLPQGAAHARRAHAAGDRPGRMGARRPRGGCDLELPVHRRAIIDELAEAVAAVRRNGIAVEAVRRENFPLTALARGDGRRPARTAGRPRHGHDAELPDRSFDREACAIAYLGLGQLHGRRPCRRTGRVTSSATSRISAATTPIPTRAAT